MDGEDRDLVAIKLWPGVTDYPNLLVVEEKRGIFL